MKRRQLFPLGLLGLLGLGKRAEAKPIDGACLTNDCDPLKRAKPVRSLRQGPTMDQLFNLQSWWRIDGTEKYYARVFSRALAITKPISVSLDGMDGVYSNSPSSAIRCHDCFVTLARPANTVLIPDSILPHIRPEHRGEEFPRGIPFVELKG